MLKRIVIVCLLTLCLLAGACSPAGDTEKKGALTGNLDPKNPVTVSLWHYYIGQNQQMLEASVSAFNQTVGIENGVVVEPIALGSIAELEENITNSAMGVINAMPMPQIFSSYPDKALEIEALDMVVNLNDYFTQAEKDLFVSDFLQDGLFDETRLLLVPIVKSTELLYVNETNWRAFADASGTADTSLGTWESLYDAARAYKAWSADPDVPWSGQALMGFDSVANYIIIGCKQQGVNVIDADAGDAGQAVLNQAALRKVFDIYYKGMSLGYFDAISKFRSDDIKAGNLVSYVGSSSSAAYFPTWIEQDNAQMPIDFLPLTYPVFEGGEPYAIQQGAGMCVAKSTPAQQEGAVLFLKWFTSPEVNINFAMTTGYLPVQSAAYDSEAFREVLTGLRGGDQAEQNVAGVYDISLSQIIDSNTYAAKPFAGSYDVRSILQSTLIDAGLAGKEAAAPLKAEGKTEEEILAALDVDAQFQQWLATIQERLTQAEIEASVQ